MKALSLKSVLPKKETLGILVSTLLLTLGVYFAYPVRGVIASFPLCFLFSSAAFFLTRRLWINSAISVGIVFFYGLMTSLADPFSFSLLVFLSTLAGSLLILCLFKIREGKRIAFSLLFFVLLALGILLPLIFCGTPARYLAAKEEAKEYLSLTYPDQRFSSLDLYYNMREKGYEAEVSYEYEGNLLTSRLFFGDEVEDGFLEDFSGWMQEKRKSDLIGILSEGEEDVLVSSAGLTEKTEDGIFHGSYGSLGKEMEPLFHFSATFREEKPQREQFARACTNVFKLLSERSFDYGRITFYALDAGNVVYECTVTPETDPETILSLVTYAR